MYVFISFCFHSRLKIGGTHCTMCYHVEYEYYSPYIRTLVDSIPPTLPSSIWYQSDQTPFDQGEEKQEIQTLIKMSKKNTYVYQKNL